MLGKYYNGIVLRKQRHTVNIKSILYKKKKMVSGYLYFLLLLILITVTIKVIEIH